VFETTKRNVGLLMGATALTLSIGVGTAAGVVPQVGKTAASVTLDFAPSAPAPVDPGPAQVAPPPPPPPPTTVPPTTTPRPAPATTAAPRRAARQAANPGAAASAPAAAAPAGPTKAARLSPSSAEIQGVIAQVSQRIPLFRPTEAQVRQFGNDVCSAFDAGLPYAQVKAQVQQALPNVPLVPISSADIDYAIRTAMGLFCPGYASLLP
jgi:hypothetical protein